MNLNPMTNDSDGSNDYCVVVLVVLVVLVVVVVGVAVLFEELTAKKDETMRKVTIETTSISKFRAKVAVRPPQFEDDGGSWSVILPLLKSFSHTEWAAISSYLTSRKYLREHIERRDTLEVERQDWVMALEMREISDSAAVSTRPRLVRNDSLM